MNKQKAIVSVIIPTYNRDNFVGQAIDSVLNQTFRDFEVIVVDDGSKDNTEEIIKTFQRKDKRIQYIRHERNKGSAAARNTGIKNARGNYIAFLDSDDLWFPRKLEKQIQKFMDVSSKVGVVYCGYFEIYNEQIIHQKLPILNGNIYKHSLRKCPIGSPTPLIKRECLEKVGLFDERLPSCQDWDLWIRIAKFYEFDFVSEILAVHCCHGNQISTDLDKKIIGREMILTKYKEDLFRYPDIFSWHLRRLGALYCLKGDTKKSRRYLLTSLKVNPLNIGSWIHIFLSYISVVLHKNMIKKYGLRKIDNFFIID